MPKKRKIFFDTEERKKERFKTENRRLREKVGYENGKEWLGETKKSPNNELKMDASYDREKRERC